MQNLKALQEKYKNEMLEFYNKSKQSAIITNATAPIAQSPIQTPPTYQAKFTPAVDVDAEFKNIDNVAKNDRDQSEPNEDYVTDGVYNLSPTDPASSRNIPPEYSDLYGGTGKLVVMVTTAMGTIPVKDATVIVEKQLVDENGNINKILVDVALTDESGKTIGEIPLPTKPKEQSLSPNYPDPYSKYEVYVIAKGFKPTTLNDVYMFDTVESVQNVDLIPMS